MNRFTRTLVLSLGVAATALSAVAPAQARDWRRHGPLPIERHNHLRGGEAAALGVIGLATGLIVGSAIANSRDSGPVYEPYGVDPYRNPPPPVYDGPDHYPAAPVRDYRATYGQAGTLEPWTPGWYDYCANRYRSFNPQNGTFTGYDGRQHFCTAG